MQLANRYWLMRHGQSKANANRIIASAPSLAPDPRFALTSTGRRQAVNSARSSGLGPETLVYTSNFIRAVETSRLVQEQLGAPPPVVSELLRERYFGSYDQTSESNYAIIWEGDRTRGVADEVESPQAVYDRMLSLISTIEGQHNGREILLVSHGDPLRILAQGLRSLPLSSHAASYCLAPAEIARLEPAG